MMTRLPNFCRIMVAALFCVSLSGCITVSPIYYDDDKNAAEATVKRLHELYNVQNYKEMYALLSPRAKQQVTLENVTAAFTGLQQTYGKVLNSKRIKEGITPEASRRLVKLVFETQFERGLLQESFDLYVGADGVAIDFIEKPVPVER